MTCLGLNPKEATRKNVGDYTLKLYLIFTTHVAAILWKWAFLSTTRAPIGLTDRVKLWSCEHGKAINAMLAQTEYQ